MLNFIAWYLTITLLGLLTFPLAYRLFPALADRGYSMSRALGLLLWAFIFWLSVSLGLARNDAGGLLLGLLALTALILAFNWIKETGTESRLDIFSPFRWIATHWQTALTVELLFLGAFTAMAFIRASNPEAVGTEKPMELAFINAILRSETFPPHDPWLSGYAISYYYFGYVMAAMLAKFTATSGAVAFNLMLALVFGMGAVGAFGIVHNLLRAYFGETSPARAIWGGLFAPLFLLLVSNLEGFLEVLHRYGMFWTFGPDGSGASAFWKWLNIKDLVDAPATLGWQAQRFWWWWRASRVVTDVEFNGNIPEVIDEFPFFSFLLGDLHPHVLAIPFGMLAAGMALNLFLGGWDGETKLWKLSLPVRREALALLAVMLGGLAFLNTWDFPIYLAVVTGAFALSQVQKNGWRWELLEESLFFAIPLALVSVLLYLPFYVGFSSQAGGILPNVIFPTRGAHLWVMFGTLFAPIFAFLLYINRQRGGNWKLGLSLSGGFALLLWLFSVALGLIAARTDTGMGFIQAQGFTSAGELLKAATLRRFEYIGGLLTLVTLIGGAAAYLSATKAEGREESAGELPGHESLPGFTALLVLVSGLLILAPDFVYLRDGFGTRMNTVFKFYYQAWMLGSLAASFGLAVLLVELRGLAGRLAVSALVLVTALGLFYPALALPDKTSDFNPPNGHTLDASAHLDAYSADDAQAIRWLLAAQPGVVAEAIGGSYSEFARVATYSGLPTVLGWEWHEIQWRGTADKQAGRNEDIRTLYETPNWEQAKQVLERYNIKYVYVGALERRAYKVNEEKFTSFLTQVYNQGQVVIYEVP
jgi:YYY domain-containing protein